MTKISKILSILLICLLFTSFVQATDIDMNLQSNPRNNDETINTNMLEDEDATNTRTSNANRNSVLTDTPSTTITSGSSVSDEALGLTNILNILLIVVGVVLILLGIAILIRMHS